MGFRNGFRMEITIFLFNHGHFVEKYLIIFKDLHISVFFELDVLLVWLLCSPRLVTIDGWFDFLDIVEMPLLVLRVDKLGC